jgi:hypothetical protein
MKKKLLHLKNAASNEEWQPDNEQHMSKHRTKVDKRPLSECNHPQQQQQKQTTIENNKKMEYIR